MTGAGATFRGAPATAADEVPFPRTVAELEGLGFVRLGRLERVGDAAPDVAARSYTDEHRRRFLDGKREPAAVLASPDRTTIAVVDWFWDMPEIRMRSLLDDGSLVETWRAWDREPVLPSRLKPGQVDLRREQVLSSSPRGGRSIVLSSGSPTDQWSEHRAQLDRARHGRSLVPFDDIATVAALSERILAHDVLVARRAVHRDQLVALAVLGLVLLLVTLPTGSAAVVAVVALLCSAVLLTRRGRLAVRYSPVLRPPFRVVAEPLRRP